MSNLLIPEICLKIDDAFQDVVDWVNAQSEDHLNKELYDNKWTAAGHVFHLVKTTKAISNGMKVPKLALRLKFGALKRKEKTYDELVNQFTVLASNTKFVAKEGLTPAKGRQFKKAELIQRLRDEQKDFKALLYQWDEKLLSKYMLPHPVVGKLSLREFAYFNAMHTWHHLRILKEEY